MELADGASPTELAERVIQEEPTIAIQSTDAGVAIEYVGTLQSADNVEGPYTDVQGASSPFTATGDQSRRFYRSRN